MTTAENTDTRAALSLAASLLDSVGADMWTPCEVVVPCLAAAELLKCAGGRASRIALVGGEAGPSIRAALAALARLDQDPTGYVLEAVRVGRYALDLLRCWQHPAAAVSPALPARRAHKHLRLLPPWAPSAGVSALRSGMTDATEGDEVAVSKDAARDGAPGGSMTGGRPGSGGGSTQ